MTRALLALSCLLVGCGNGVTPARFMPQDAGTSTSAADAGATSDAGFDGGLSLDDAGVSNDAGVPLPPCRYEDAKVICPARLTQLGGRDVYWQQPTSAAPTTGYPLVIVYQGSFFAPSATWGEVAASAPYGGYQQARMQALLLEHGFTVVAPSAIGGVAWQTNSGLLWDFTNDKVFIDALLAEIRSGRFGPADTSRLYATGISSGGYMTSRMAVSYAGVFRALVINAGSYATCAGAACLVPSTLPAQHPPTRFLHGRVDFTVPLSTAETYEQRLQAQGFVTDLIIDDNAGHEWLAQAPERILEWFQSH